MKAKDFENIVVLTGAGISADSGLSTFRDSNGLWENHPIEEVATPEAFAKNPELVWKFYSLRRENAANAQPNDAHRALDEFAKYCNQNNKKFTLITQNVDTLHERVRSADYEILTMHGTLSRSRCELCHKVIDDFNIYDVDKNGIPQSNCCNKQLRPDIVWFGEIPQHLDEIENVLKGCDLFVSIGTSGNVYPAAGFIQVAKMLGAKTVVLNLEELAHSPNIDLFIPGRAVDIVTDFFNF